MKARTELDVIKCLKMQLADEVIERKMDEVAQGRTLAVDAAGSTATAYDAYGDVASESVSGLYSRSLSHVRDAYGRDLGYTLNNSRKNIIEYETDAGRIKRVMFAGAWYTYSYLPGTDLKASLAVGSAGRTDWSYEPARDLLAQVKNTAFGSIVSQYDYTSDAIGRRTEISRSGSRMTESRSDAYSYNDRNELVGAGRVALVATACREGRNLLRPLMSREGRVSARPHILRTYRGRA